MEPITDQAKSKAEMFNELRKDSKWKIAPDRFAKWIHDTATKNRITVLEVGLPSLERPETFAVSIKTPTGNENWNIHYASVKPLEAPQSQTSP